MMSLEKKAEAGALPPTKESLSFILKVPAFLLAVEKKKRERETKKYKTKNPAYQCRRHKRCRFDPWVRKIL